MKTVRLKPVQKGVRTYYYSQILVSIFGFKVWKNFIAWSSTGEITIDYLGLDTPSTKSIAESYINDLKFIYGEDNVKIVEYGTN